MEMNFCRRCGKELINLQNHIYRCKNNHTIYANASPTTSVFIIDDDSNVTLSVRGIEPRKGMLDAFGGFLDGAELLETGLRRELKEELDLDKSDYTEPVFLCSGIGNYPLEGEILPVLSLSFFIKLKTGVKLTPKDDVAGTVTFKLNEVPLDKLHDQDIVAGIKALQAHFS